MIDLEAICAKVSLPSCFIFIYCLYIQPSATLEIYNAHIQAIEQLQNDASVNDMILILGDFNLGSAAVWEANDDGFDFIPSIGESKCIKANIAREITSSMMNFGLSQMSDFKNKFTNVLDLVYSNSPDLTVVSKADFLMIPSEKSDVAHVPLMCTVECSPKILPAGSSNSTFCFKKANFDLIRDHLLCLELEKMLKDLNDVNEMTSILYSAIYNAFELFVPRAIIRSTNKPILHNKELSRLKNFRNKEYKKLYDQRQNCPNADEDPFLNAKLNFEQYRRQRHNDFIREKASSLKPDPKSFWKFINEKRKSNSLPSTINYEGQTAIDDSEKANLFSKFFQNVYTRHETDSSLDDFITERSDQNCFRMNISSENVYSVLSLMDLNKGSGHDNVPSIFLRQCAEVLCQPLAMIFSRSFSDGCYPEQFKMGQITPIYKSGKKSDATNYRGVNVLPNLAKVFERAVYCQMKMIIAPRISKTQHGFLANRNIESNLMELSTLVHDAFEKGA